MRRATNSLDDAPPRGETEIGQDEAGGYIRFTVTFSYGEKSVWAEMAVQPGEWDLGSIFSAKWHVEGQDYPPMPEDESGGKTVE